MHMIQKKFLFDKKGVSIMIGYILLVVFILAISAGIFQWLKSYVPGESFGCPDGVSLYVNNSVFNSETSTLSVSFVNTGTFNLRGYYINLKKTASDDIAATNISQYLIVETSGGAAEILNSVTFADKGQENPNDNNFLPGETETHYFDIPESITTIYSVQITPTRFEETDGKVTFTSCANAITEQLVE